MAKKDKNSLNLRSSVYGTPTINALELKAGANKLGEWFLLGLGAFGKLATAPFTLQGPTSSTIYKSKELLDKEQTIDLKSEELLGKAMTWVSPLNYGVALATGNGLNARKGEEEVASWSPAALALGRVIELYAGPKGARGAIKGTKAGVEAAVNMAAKAGSKSAKKAVVARKINKVVNETNDLSKLLAFDLFQELTSAPTSKITRLRPEFSLAMQDKNYMFGRLLWSTNLTKDRYATSLTKHIKVMDTKLADPQVYVTQALYPLAIKNGGLRATHGGLTRPIWLNSNKPYFGTPTGVSNSTNYTYIIDANKFTPELNLLRNIGGTHYEYPGTAQLPIEGTKRILWDPVLLQYTSTIFTEAPKSEISSTASLKFFERKPSENNIVGASYDYRIEDPKGSMDFLKLFFALLKINGKEYTLEGLKDAANVQQGLPEHIQSYLNLNTVERAVRAMRKNGYSEREIQLYIDKVNEEMNKVKVGMYSDLEYNAAGALDFGGFYNKESNFISVNRDAHLKDSKFTPEYIMKHEGRHLIDYNTSMTDDVINTLEKAYDKDFLEIPKHEDAGSLKDYQHMDRERVTTNRDARDVLLTNKGKYLLNKHDFIIDSSKRGYSTDMIDFLNKIIKYVLPEDIVNAVENSNGYGKRYINYLKKNNKLTPTKIEQLRLAMIQVPSYLLPVAGGYTLYNLFNQPLQQLQYLKQGGKMNILEFLKNGSGIHIKEKNKGKFTSYCGGKVTDECILKGKNSSNPAIRKRATFADNARHFKHKSGGKIDFYNLGGWFKNTFNNVSSFLGSDTVKSILSTGSSLLGLGKGISNSGKIADLANAAKEAVNERREIDKRTQLNQHFLNILNEELLNPIIEVNGSPIHTNGVDVSNRAYNKAINTFSFDDSKYNQEIQLIDLYAQQVLNENSSSMIGSVGGLIDSIGGIAGSLLNKKSTAPKTSLIITGNPNSSKQVITTNSGMSGTVDDWRKAIMG